MDGMRYLASIDTEPATSGTFATADAAITWARENAAGRTWAVAEMPDQPGPPRIVATSLTDRPQDQ